MNRGRTTGIAIAIAAAVMAGQFVLATNDRDPAAAADAKSASARAERRAFYTAPPTVPHEIQAQGSDQCAFCHSKVLEIGERVSVETPHPQLSNCQQCHVGEHLLNADLAVTDPENGFVGLVEPRKGSRISEVAPPTIPHRRFMREGCNACHGPDNPDVAVRGSHPERSSCLQCHVESHFEAF